MNEITQAAATLGKLGGKSKSPAKQAASRENGRKGGRPLGRKAARELASVRQETGLDITSMLVHKDKSATLYSIGQPVGTMNADGEISFSNRNPDQTKP